MFGLAISVSHHLIRIVAAEVDVLGMLVGRQPALTSEYIPTDQRGCRANDAD